MKTVDAVIAVVVAPWLIGPTLLVGFLIGAQAIAAVTDREGERLITVGI